MKQVSMNKIAYFGNHVIWEKCFGRELLSVTGRVTETIDGIECVGVGSYNKCSGDWDYCGDAPINDLTNVEYDYSGNRLTF